MSLKILSARALQIHDLFKKRETKRWGKKDLMLGMVGDVGELAKLVLAQEGLRDIADKEQKLKHELADCLWAILILAHEYNINLDETFMSAMDDLERKLI